MDDKLFENMLDRFAAASTERRKQALPEDAANEVQAIAEGKQYAPGFCDDHLEWFVALVGTYADDDAHELLDALRERFWTTARPALAPTAKKETP
jgi:hypothetical protein